MDNLENLMLILTCDCLLTIYRKSVRGECFASIICEQNVSNHEPIKNLICVHPSIHAARRRTQDERDLRSIYELICKKDLS
jgi:hypothetical protein